VSRSEPSHQIKRRWRDYRTAMGRRPVKEFLDGLSDVDAAAVAASMKDVREHGMVAARHLRSDIYEVRADGDRQSLRILFAQEGEHGQVLLSLSGFSKKTQKTPPNEITLAEKRLRDWRERGSKG
jgi:phage-related protein